MAILEISSRSVIAPLHTCQNFQIQILYLHCEMTLKTIPPEEVKICKEYNMMGIFSFLTFIFLRLETCADPESFFRGGPTSTTFILYCF